MEANKTVNEELQGQKSTNILIGYVLSLALMFVAFEYTQREVKIVDDGPIYNQPIEEDMIPITHQEETMAPPPAAAPTVMEIINEVEDDTELPEEEIQTTEEVNQVITNVVGTGAPSAAVVASGPVVEADDDDQIFNVVEQEALFPGGMEALYKFIQDHLNYPSIAREQEIQGRVTVQFVVNKDGSITDVKVLKSPDASLSKEAERVVKLMPRWTAAKQGNKPVRSYFRLPVNFRLQ